MTISRSKHVTPVRKRDIVVRKRKTLAARQTEDCYRLLVDNAEDIVELSDADGRMLYISPSYSRITGWSAEEIRATDWQKRVHPDDLVAIERARAAGLRGETTLTRRRALCKDGSWMWLESRCRSVVSADGKVQKIVVWSRDISEQMRTEETHFRLATAVEQAAETIVITDANATILYANPAFERTTGYTLREAIGQNPRILKSGKQDAAFYRQMWAVLARGEVWSGRLINKRKDGALYEEDATISPVRDCAGNIVNYVAVNRDITREAQLESQLRQSQKMEAVGQLAGGVAHDFNNLLTAILGCSDIILRRLKTDDPLHSFAEDIRQAGLRGANLTRQLLAFGRKQVLQPTVLDLNALAANLQKMLHRIIGEDIQLRLSTAPDLLRVRADPSQIEQVIMNLVVNARDAMPQGGQITIETANVELDEANVRNQVDVTAGSYVMLAVTDTGVGMTSEVKAHIFEPFFTTKEQGKGTGLGLSTVYGIVKQSGGHISFHSEPNRGTTFKILLPGVARTDDDAPDGTADTLPRGTETVLLVEDENQVRKMACALLEYCGYTVLVAANGLEALRLAKQHKGKIQLLLTDIVMPRMSGPVLAPLLVSLNPGIKVLYMSGYTEKSIFPKVLPTAGSAFLQKPFTPDVLARKVREVLQSCTAEILPMSPAQVAAGATSEERHESRVESVTSATPSTDVSAPRPLFQAEMQSASVSQRPRISKLLPDRTPLSLRVLIVDDEPEVLQYLQAALSELGYLTKAVTSGQEALQVMPEFAAEIALIDYRMEGMNGIETLQKLRLISPGLLSVIMTGAPDLNIAAEAIREFAFDFLYKPIDPIELDQCLWRATVHLDIRDREMREKDLLFIVSHQLRDPLQPPLSIVENLLSGRYGLLTDKQRNRLQVCFKNLHTEAQMVDSLLTLNYLRAGRFNPQLRAYSLRDAVQEVIHAYEFRAAEKGVRLLWETTRDPFDLDFDVSLIKQAVSNILCNAVQHTDQGKTVQVTLESDDGEIHCVVRDEGLGISTVKQRTLFSRSTPEGGKPGLGIGLFVANEIIRAHGGRITVESKVNHGSTFCITIPNNKKLDNPNSANEGQDSHR